MQASGLTCSLVVHTWPTEASVSACTLPSSEIPESAQGGRQGHRPLQACDAESPSGGPPAHCACLRACCHMGVQA